MAKRYRTLKLQIILYTIGVMSKTKLKPTKKPDFGDFPAPHQYLADDVRELRALLDMTQDRFAKLLGISKIAVVRWESSTDQANPVPPPVCRLFDVIRRNPSNYINSLGK